MPFSVYSSPRLEVLFDHIAALPAPTDPFRAECIVVQSRHAAAPLLAALSARRGVAAHIDTPTVGRFFRRLDAAIPAEDPARKGGWDFDGGGLTAALCSALLTRRDDPRFASLAWHRNTDGRGGHVTGPLFALARQLSATFARYARFAPHLLDGWERGEESDDWQAQLWRDIAPLAANPSPQQRLSGLARRIRDLASLPSGLPERLVVHGHRLLDPGHLEVLDALANHLDVQVFVLGAPETHPSLQSLVERFDAGRLAGAVALRHASHVDGNGSVLSALQGRLAGHDTIVARATDASFQFHSFKGAVAQVEALRDHILSALNDDPTLEPRDIHIATPDVATFAPIIETIFAEVLPPLHPDAPPPPRLVPRLSDIPEGIRNPLAAAIGAAFELADSRLEIDSVCLFLARPLIMEALELDDDRLNRCRRWFEEAAIRWGRDEHHRKACGQPAVRLHTWRHGFDRLLLGYALGETHGDTPPTYDDLAPIESVEGSEVNDLGRCIDFLARLFDLMDAMQRPARVEAWQDLIIRMTRLLVGQHPDAMTLVQDTWASLLDLDMGLELDFDLDAVRTQLRALLRTSRPSPSFQAGGITVTELAPDRALPRRHIYLVGVDDGSFGGERGVVAFDRLTTERPDEGRRALLEFLLAARERLVLVWNAGDATDGPANGQPATPVQELARCVTRLATGAPAGDETAVEMPRTASWQGVIQPAAMRHPPTVPWPADATLPAGAASETSTLVSLKAFIDAYTEPHKTLLTTLGVTIVRPREQAPAREPIEPNALELYTVAERLIALYLAGLPEPRARRLLRAEGRLPYGHAGDVVFDAQHQRARLIADTLADIVEERTGVRERRFPLPLTTARVDVHVGAHTLSGHVSGVIAVPTDEPDPNVGPLRLCWRSGRLRAKDEIRLWIEHLALTVACTRAPTSIHVARSPDRGGRIALHTLPPLPRALARRELEALVALHARHREHVTDFYPDTGRSFTAALDYAAARSSGPNLRPAETSWYTPRAFGGDSPGGDSLSPEALLLTEARREPGYPFNRNDFRETSWRLFDAIGAWLQHGRR